MGRRRRERFPSLVLLPAVLAAVGTLAFFTVRTTLQVERSSQQAILEATLGLASEKADRLDKRIIEQDNAVFAIADPSRLSDLTQRWLPTAQRETPTVRAVLVLDETRTVLAFASRASGAFAEEEAFRRLLVERMCADMELSSQPPDELRHLHREYRGQSYLVSYWQRLLPSGGVEEGDSPRPRRFLIVAWHDIGRIVRDTMPPLFSERDRSERSQGAASPSRVNVLDEDGRIIFGPPLRSGEFTVAVRFPTTLYGWRVQVSPSAGDELTSRVRNRVMLELVLVVLSCVVIVLGVVTILFAAERERRISALKSEFVANVSHELKTPLALVRMFGEMLQSGRVTNDAKRKEYLDIIVSESERLSSLIENVLDFARVERGRQAYDFAEGSVADAVAKAVNVYRYRAEREGIELDADIDRDLPSAMIDERAIQLAIINLIDNALKYAPRTEVVTVQVRREGRWIVVRVIDRGPGVPFEDRERIFERFVRGSTVDVASARSPVRGSGIGLALVKHIAESHGGRAWVETAGGIANADGAPGSRPGASFAIEIPIAREPGAGPASAVEPGEAGAAEATESAEPTGEAGGAGATGVTGLSRRRSAARSPERFADSSDGRSAGSPSAGTGGRTQASAAPFRLPRGES
ncbi:MAG TPA: HAMP domain-containing sensor histidine kinase [Polyangiaceae bacterium]|nr:HAMP domain-containing sensor histidine kinase [Polyangiaceae bacterium]